MNARVWLAVAAFVVPTFVISAVLYWLQFHFGIAWSVINLGTFGPLAGGLIALALRKPLNLPIFWVPGLGFNVQVVRRTVLGAGIALAIVLGCVQTYSFMRWGLRPLDLYQVQYPFAMPGDIFTMFSMVALGILIGSIAEEFGWRTVLEPTLRRGGASVLGTAIVIGVVWACWQVPVFQAAVERWRFRAVPVEIALYLLGHVAVCIAVSLILVLLHQRMARGHWLSSVAFRFVMTLGFWLILDEEAGRWQPMWAIAVACSVAAAVGLYYYLRDYHARRPRKQRLHRVSN